MSPLHLAIAATQQLDIISLSPLPATQQLLSPQATMVHPICFDDTAAAVTASAAPMCRSRQSK